MAEEDTELIFINAWSENTLDISNGKMLFQELPEPKSEAPQWIEDNPKDCLILDDE